MLYLAALLLAGSAPAHSAPALQDDYDHDMLCYAYNASEASNARDAGDTAKFNMLVPRAMFFRGMVAERFKDAAAFDARRTEAIRALSSYPANGKDLLESECQARMRVAMNSGG
jgi:hypothetical protein